jgi:AAA15 family ATPase/GTPase
VNLLVGKNNTGKTSVLEAVYLWANYGRFETVYEILEARDGMFESVTDDRFIRSQATLISLFTDRLIHNLSQKISISFQKESTESWLTFSLNHIKIEVKEGQANTELLTFVAEHSDYEISSQIRADQFLRLKEPNFPNYNFPRDIKNNFVKSSGENTESTSTLYDKISTTDLEEEVINALKLINNSIFKITFRTDEVTAKRYPVVRLEGSDNPFPLRSMGDGINRILTIILAMVNCEKGYLLIDEFENGLHYSVQEKLWEIIFYLSERLNIQVFATTHSNDTIKAFGEVANSKPEYSNAQLIQLRNIKDEISAVLFNSQDVEIAIETDYLDLR